MISSTASLYNITSGYFLLGPSSFLGLKFSVTLLIIGISLVGELEGSVVGREGSALCYNRLGGVYLMYLFGQGNKTLLTLSIKSFDNVCLLCPGSIP